MVPTTCIVARNLPSVRYTEPQALDRRFQQDSILTTTTFGYSPQQDRIWMRVHQQETTIWLTRRMVLQIVGPLLDRFAQSTPGAQGGAPAATRAAIEHDLTLHEVAPGQAPAQIRAGREQPSPRSDPQEHLCTRITTRTTAQLVELTFESAAGPLNVRLSRKGMHLWYRGLSMVLKQARWDLPKPLPEWLTSSVMPASLQSIVQPPPKAEPPTS